LIFLDIMTPGLEGIEIFKRIRQLEIQYGVKEYAKSKVIMTSANTDKDVILKATRADCTSYMIKPIDKTRLYKEIRNHGFDISEHLLMLGLFDNGYHGSIR
jgi:two-component system, chemotaxis family, chemotaxis protein CheY